MPRSAPCARALRTHELDALLIFCSDNGAQAPRGVPANAPLKGRKGELSEGGHRVPFIASWPGVIAPGTTKRRHADDNGLLPVPASAPPTFRPTAPLTAPICCRCCAETCNPWTAIFTGVSATRGTARTVEITRTRRDAAHTRKSRRRSDRENQSPRSGAGPRAGTLATPPPLVGVSRRTMKLPHLVRCLAVFPLATFFASAQDAGLPPGAPLQPESALPDYEKEIDHAGSSAAGTKPPSPAAKKSTRPSATSVTAISTSRLHPQRPAFRRGHLRPRRRSAHALPNAHARLAPHGAAGEFVPREKYDVIHYLRETYLREKIRRSSSPSPTPISPPCPRATPPAPLP